MSGPQKTSQSAIFLLKQLHAQAIDPKKLTRRQRELCVRHLIMEYRYSQQQIGDIVGCTRESVSRIKSRLLEQDSWMLTSLDERKIAVDLMQKAEMCFTRLVKQEKYREAWVVTKEKIEALQSLGYIYKKPLELEGQITLLDILKNANSPRSGTGAKTEPTGLRPGLESVRN